MSHLPSLHAPGLTASCRLAPRGAAQVRPARGRHAGTTQTYKFFSLTGSDGAETFFAAHSLRLGDIQSSISLSYDLTFSAGTLANVGDGFGFTYDLADPRLSATWAMMALGFAGLAFAGYRRSRKGAAFAV